MLADTLDLPKSVLAKFTGIEKLIRRAGSWDAVADDVFSFGDECFRTRLAVHEMLRIDNILHRDIAKSIVQGKRPSFTRTQWEGVLRKILQALDAKLAKQIASWDKRYDRLFGFSVGSLKAARRTIHDVLTD